MLKILRMVSDILGLFETFLWNVDILHIHACTYYLIYLCQVMTSTCIAKYLIISIRLFSRSYCVEFFVHL